MLMDNIIVRALSRMFDLILLNLLWLACSLPVITIGGVYNCAVLRDAENGGE